MRRYLLSAMVFGLLFSVPGIAQADVVAKINLSNQRMSVFVNGAQRYNWPVSTARAGYRTPTGTFKPTALVRYHRSSIYDGSPMPYSIFFLRGYAIHGSYETKHLGRPASHGCVRSHPKNAKIFYDLVQKHGMQMTRVTVQGKPPYSPAVADGPRRRRYAQPANQPFSFFGYNQQAYQPKVKKAKKKQYGGSYNTW